MYYSLKVTPNQLYHKNIIHANIKRLEHHSQYQIGKNKKREHWHCQHSPVNVGEEGLSPHKLKNEKVINCFY